MVNFLAIYMPLLRGLLKLVGMRSQAVEIEPGTVVHFWVPSETTTSGKDGNLKQKGDKPAVVFLHGFALNGILTWQFQVLALAKEYAVYVPDFLFFGDSVTDRSERSREFQAESVAKGLRKLGVEKCTLVGLSYGGMVAFKMAEMYPELVDSMVITCSVMALTESISSASLARIGFSSWTEYMIPDTVKGLKEMLDIAMYKLPSWLPNFVFKDLLETMFENGKERSELLQALVINDKDFNIPNNLPLQKVHLLWGANDKIFNMECARNLKQQLDGKATLQSIDKAGHLVQSERPFVYNMQLKKILASLHEDRKQKQI